MSLRRTLVHDAPRRAKHLLEGHATFVGSVTSVATETDHVVLTYDDGPEPGGTDAILTALADRGVRATFFVLLTRVRRYPQLLGEVVSAGHDIALHGLDHRKLTSFAVGEVKQRTTDARAELEDAVQRPVRWIRPPYGRQTLGTWRAVRATGLEPVMWGPSLGESAELTRDQRVNRALDSIERGSILLGHDGYAGPADRADDGPAPVLDRGELTARVLDAYAERGLVGCSLSEALGSGEPVRRAWFQR